MAQKKQRQKKEKNTTPLSENKLSQALGSAEVDDSWLSPTKARSLVLDDDIILWLKKFEDEHEYEKEESEYSFLRYIMKKGHKFEEKYNEIMLEGAPQVCEFPFEVGDPNKVEETFDMMRNGEPVILQPALWWEPEQVYGTPDLIGTADWVRDKYGLGPGGDHYVALDIKYSSKLDSNQKKKDRAIYEAQVRLYSQILGRWQDKTPDSAYLITRDTFISPMSVNVRSGYQDELPDDIQYLRDRYQEIMENGEDYSPEDVPINPNERNESFGHAKKDIARNKKDGGDIRLLPWVSDEQAKQFKEFGYETLEDVLNEEPDALPLLQIKGLGKKSAGRIREMIRATQKEKPLVPEESVPPKRENEFHFDFEYCTNVNASPSEMERGIQEGKEMLQDKELPISDEEHPEVKGTEMIAKVGVGYEDDDGRWHEKVFEAEQENLEEEERICDEFVQFLDDKTNGDFTDEEKSVLYHYSHAERTQIKRAANRQNWGDDHPLRNLPLHDLQDTVTGEDAAGFPESFSYGLKNAAHALAEWDDKYDPEWPEGLGEGLEAMVMIWRYFKIKDYEENDEVTAKGKNEAQRINKKVNEYLNADCRALHSLLRWLRNNQEE